MSVYLRELRKFLIDNSAYLSLHSIFQWDFDDHVSSIYNYVIFTSKKCTYNAQISTLNFKSAERVLAMIMHLPTLLKTMCSLFESKSVNAILGT